MADLVLQNATLLDTRAGVLREGAVRVEGERIVEVEGGAIRHAGVREVDLRGRVLMPGLIDAHVHAVITTLNLAALQQRPVTLIAQEARQVLEAMLRRGFTSVRDRRGAKASSARSYPAPWPTCSWWTGIHSGTSPSSRIRESTSTS